MGCCSGIFRIILFLVNAACFLIGAAMIAVGVVYLFNFSDFTDRLDEFSNLFSVVPILLIVLGCVIFVISFLGCCGALNRNSCMLTTYAIILIVILALQIAFVIYTFVQANDSSGWKGELLTAMEKLFNDNSDTSVQAVDFIQETWECCGFNGPPTFQIPLSCCAGEVTVCTDPFPEGCSIVLYNFLTSSMNTIGIVVVSLAAVEFIGAILAIWISRGKRY